MARQGLTITIQITGLREALRAFNRMPPEANKALRAASLKLSEKLATDARRRAVQRGTQARLIAPTIRASRDRVPAVTAGGSVRVGRNRKPAYKVLFGSEFGAKLLHQFPTRNTTGYYLFPAVRGMRDQMDVEWNRAADEIVRSFSEDT